jgi:hypothetical protein
MYLVRENFHATIKCGGLPSQHSVCILIFSTHCPIEHPPSTGASPHGCDFCEDRFKDPSKRHKHMLRSHGYRPGESRKKFRSEEESAQGQSAHESLEPWKVAGTSEC